MKRGSRARPADATAGVPRGGAAEGWVVGFHSVLAVLERQPELVELLLVADTPDGRQRRVLDVARQRRVRFRFAPRRELDGLAGGIAHNGFAVRLSSVPLSDPDDLLELATPVCLLGLDAIEDPHNLGAVIRIAAGLGLGGVVVGGPHPPPLGGAVAKVAAGTLPLVRVAHAGSLGDFVRAAKDAGFWVFGAAADAPSITQVELPDRLVLCVGAEAGGLRAKTRAALDGTVGIPLATGVESLNVAVASGILAWEWRRRYPLPEPNDLGRDDGSAG